MINSLSAKCRQRVKRFRVGRAGIPVNRAGLEKITSKKIEKYVIGFCYYYLLKGGLENGETYSGSGP